MSLRATGSDEALGAGGACPDRAPGSKWKTLGRHQIGSLVAGVVDFGVMIIVVEAFRLSPVTGTAAGATLGACTNFGLGRAWIFQRHTGGAAPQAFRYALVSFASAAWNSAGEHLMHDIVHLQYILARVIVALGVSLLWNFPLQQRFVFRERRTAA